MNKNKTYKDSGIEWIGNIPKHWEISKLKYISKITYGISPHRDTYNYEGDGMLLINGPAEYSKADFGYTRPLKWTTAPQNLVPAGVLLFCLRASIGRLNITHTNLSIGRGVCSIEASINQNFLVFCMMMIKIYIQGQMSGSVFPSVTKKDVDNFILPMPPLKEQKLIARYLDKKTVYIDSLLEKIQKKVELLKEQRTSLINQCVTKGITSKVKMKESGVEWIGRIPKHWNLTKLKYLSNKSVQYGLNIESDFYNDSGVRLLRITDINQDGSLKETGCIYLDSSDVPSEYYLNQGDVLFARSGSVGKSTLINDDSPIMSFAGYLVRFSFDNYGTSKFVKWVAESEFYWRWIYLQSIQSTIPNVNGEKYSNLIFPIPSIEEQKLITRYLDEKIKRLDAFIEKIRKKLNF